MDNMRLDSIDQKLLGLLQVGFPLSREPYADLGLRLGVNQDEIIRRIEQLRDSGIVRQISPVVDARRIGYQPTLVAMRVEEAELARAERLIIEHPGVSHGYERDHYYNIWFTLAIPAGVDAESELEQLTGSIAVEAAFTLPAVRVFKIGAYFAMNGDGEGVVGAIAQPGQAPSPEIKLTKTDRLVINELQQDLPLIYTPFSAMAARLGMDEEYFLAQCQSLKERGVIRRYGAAVNHRKTGFEANAMTCWVAAQEKLEAAGRKLASIEEVSHCYERKTNPRWHHNLFAVIHGRTREACQEIARRVSAETGLNDCVMLLSTREFKKTRVKYLV